MLFRKKEFMEWEDYKKKAEFLEELWWRQRAREQSVRNL